MGLLLGQRPSWNVVHWDSFIYFGEDEVVLRFLRTIGIRRALLPIMSVVFFLICQKLLHASVYIAAALVKSSIPGNVQVQLQWSLAVSVTNEPCGSKPVLGNLHESQCSGFAEQGSHSLSSPESAMSGRILEPLCRKFCNLDVLWVPVVQMLQQQPTSCAHACPVKC